MNQFSSLFATKIGPTIEDRDAGDEHVDASFFFRPAFAPCWWIRSRGAAIDEKIRNARHPYQDKFTPILRAVRCYTHGARIPPLYPAEEDGA